MVIIQQAVQSQTSGARTSDWLGQVADHVIYAYDLSKLGYENVENIEFTKSDFEQALKKVSRRIKK